jgi:hypothetical protein
MSAAGKMGFESEESMTETSEEEVIV